MNLQEKIQIVTLPEKFRDIPILKVKSFVSKELGTDSSQFRGYVRLDKSSVVYRLSRKGVISISLPVIEAGKMSRNHLIDVNTSDPRFFGVTMGNVDKMINDYINQYPDYIFNSSPVFSNANFSSVFKPLAQKTETIKEPDEFAKKHGRFRMPGEPTTGFVVEFFSDGKTSPVVVNSLIGGATALVSDFSFDKSPSQTLAIKFFPGMGQITIDDNVLHYLNKMKKEDFVQKYTMIAHWPSDLITSMVTADRFFERPLDHNVFKKLAEFIERKNLDEGITFEIFDVRDRLLVKESGKDFRLVAEDRSEKSATLFSGKVLLESPKMGIANKGENAMER